MKGSAMKSSAPAINNIDLNFWLPDVAQVLIPIQNKLVTWINKLNAQKMAKRGNGGSSE